MDLMTIADDGERANIGLTCENRLIDLNKPRIRRYTNSDQQSEFSGDTGFSFVESLQEKTIYWGKLGK